MTLLLLFAGASGSTPASSDPGGGGFGAVMSDAHFQRYTPTLDAPGYVSRYKPTIREQKP